MQSAPNSLMFTWLTEANMLLQHWSGVLRSNTVKSISSWKTHGEPMGCSKLELLGSNNFHICHARRVHYVVSHCYPVSSFHIDILLILLPTKLVRTSSAWHRTPTDPSHTRGCMEISEPRGIQRWWHSASYSVWGNGKFATSMYKHIPMLPFCCETVFSLALPATFSRMAERYSTSYISSTS